jgi:hypothetical protein
MKHKRDAFERSIQEKFDQHEVYVPSTIWNSIKTNLPDEEEPNAIPFIPRNNLKLFSIIGILIVLSIGTGLLIDSQRVDTNSNQQNAATFTQDKNIGSNIPEIENTDDTIRYTDQSNTDNTTYSKNKSNLFTQPNNNNYDILIRHLSTITQDKNNTNNTFNLATTPNNSIDDKTPSYYNMGDKTNATQVTNSVKEFSNKNSVNSNQSTSKNTEQNINTNTSNNNQLPQNIYLTKTKYKKVLKETPLLKSNKPTISNSTSIKNTDVNIELNANTTSNRMVNQAQNTKSKNTDDEYLAKNNTSKSAKNLQQQTTDTSSIFNTRNTSIASNTTNEKVLKSNTSNASNSNQLEEIQSNVGITTNQNKKGIDSLANATNIVSNVSATALSKNNQEVIIKNNSAASEKPSGIYTLDSTNNSNTSNQNKISNIEKQIDSIAEPQIKVDTTALKDIETSTEKTKPKPTLLSKITIDGYVSPAIGFIQTKETSTTDSSIYHVSQNKKNGFGLTLGLRANYIVSPKFETGIGLQYSSTNQHIDYTFQSIDSSYISYQGYNQIDSTYDSTAQAYTYTNSYIITGSTTNTIYTNQTTSVINKYQNISIPIYLAYNYRISNRFRLVARTSILLNVEMYSITYTTSNNEPIGYHSEKAISIGGSLSVGGYYTLNNSITLFTEPILTYYFKDLFGNEAPIKQSLMSIGLQTGVRIHF